MGEVSTSHVERQNLNMRVAMRRFTRLTNGFSKKEKNQAHAISLYFFFHNYCHPHQTLTQAAGGIKQPPAITTKVTESDVDGRRHAPGHGRRDAD